LLYWYNSTITDAADERYAAAERALAQVLSLLVLLVQKHSVYLLYWYNQHNY
jgi:hypothetical protein